MNEFERTISNAVNKALNEALPSIGKTIGIGIGEGVKETISKHNEILNAKFKEINECLNAAIQINASFFEILCATNSEFRESICHFLQEHQNQRLSDNQYYSQILDFWKNQLRVTSPKETTHQDAKKSHLKLVIGNQPTLSEDQDETT